MRTKLLSLFFLFCTSFAFGAEGVFYGTRVNDQTLNNSNSLHKIFTSYFIYQLDKTAIVNYLDQNEGNATLTFVLGNEYKWEMDIQVYDLRSPNFTFVENTLNGKIIRERSKAFTYRGIVNGKAENVLALGICEELISGFVTVDGKEYFIEQANRFNKEASANEFIVYAVADVIPDANVSCGFSDIKKDHDISLQRTAEDVNVSSVCQLTEIAIAADNSMIISYGTSAAVANALTSRLNAMSLWYSTTFGIEYTIVTFYITTIPNDITPDTQFDSQTILANFRTWGNAGGFGVSKDIASFFTDRDICDGTNCGNIGYSYFNGICNTNGYNVLEDYGSNAVTSRNYWCHECGHTWSAIHTSPQNTTTFMNPIIYNGSNTTVLASTMTSITNFKNSCTCLDFCVGTSPIEADPLNFNLYPNPANGNITVELFVETSAELQFVITDVLGQVIFTEKLSANAGAFQKQFDLSKLSSGTYFIQTNIGNKILTKRFVRI